MVKGGFQKAIVFLSASGRVSEKVYILRICCPQGILFPLRLGSTVSLELYDILLNPTDHLFTPSDD